MAEVLYQFIASGQGDVEAAFVRIGTAATASGATTEAAYTRVERAQTKATRSAEKSAEQRARADEKAADKKAKAEERAAAKIEKTYNKLEGDWEKALAREVLATEKAAQRKAAIEERANARMEKTRARSMSKLGTLAEQAGVAAMRSIAGGVTDIIGGAVRESFALSEIARRVSINARGAGKDAVDPAQLKKEFEDTAIKTPGIKSEDIGLAAQKYVDLTGDLDAARANMQTFATVASATGAKIDDVATAAASLGAKFNVKSVADMQKVMAVLTFQGKGNALMMKDLAAQFQKLAAAGAAFGLGQGPEAVAKLGGIMQVARGGTRSAQSAGTAVENIFKQLVAKSPALAAQGVKLTDAKGHKRDIDDVLTDIVSKFGGGNLGRKEQMLSKFFGAQGYRGITPLLGAYRTAYEGAGGGKGGEEAGRAAVAEALRKATEASSDFGEVEKDAAAAQAEASAQLTAAWEQLKANVSAELVPALVKLAPKLGELVPILDPAITIFVALAEAAKLLLDALIALKIIEPKKETKAAAAERTAKELENFEGQTRTVKSMAELDALVDKHEALRKAAGDAQEAFMPSAAPGEISNLSKMPGGRHPSENFVDKFATAQGWKPGSVGWKAASEHARDIEERIKGGERGNITGGGAGWDNQRTEATKGLVQARIEEEISSKAKADFEASAKAHTQAAADLKAAAADLRGVAKTGTIIGGP